MNDKKEVVLRGEVVNLGCLSLYDYCLDDIVSVIRRKTKDNDMPHGDREIKQGDFESFLLTKDKLWDQLQAHQLVDVRQSRAFARVSFNSEAFDRMLINNKCFTDNDLNDKIKQYLSSSMKFLK